VYKEAALSGQRILDGDEGVLTPDRLREESTSGLCIGEKVANVSQIGCAGA
jgi:hypothetical protein